MSMEMSKSYKQALINERKCVSTVSTILSGRTPKTVWMLVFAIWILAPTFLLVHLFWFLQIRSAAAVIESLFSVPPLKISSTLFPPASDLGAGRLGSHWVLACQLLCLVGRPSRPSKQGSVSRVFLLHHFLFLVTSNRIWSFAWITPGGIL